MGQKVNPNSFRYGITKKRNVNWIANKKTYTKYLGEDVKIRTFFEKFVREYLIGQIEIHRTQDNSITIFVHTAKIGSFIGQNGENLQKITTQLHKFIKNKTAKINIQSIEIKNAALNARLVAESIASQLEHRGSYRMAQKQAIRNSLKAGAIGIKTQVAGRLNGVDIARTEGYTKGIMSLHTLRQDVDYATAIAHTTYGAIGVKVWLSKGKILVKKGEQNATTQTN